MILEQNYFLNTQFSERRIVETQEIKSEFFFLVITLCK